MTHVQHLTQALFGIYSAGDFQSAVRNGLAEIQRLRPELLREAINVPHLAAGITAELSRSRNDALFVLLGLMLLHERKETEFEMLLQNARHYCHKADGVELLSRVLSQYRLEQSLISIVDFAARVPHASRFVPANKYVHERAHYQSNYYEIGLYYIENCAVVGNHGILMHLSGAVFKEQPYGVSDITKSINMQNPHVEAAVQGQLDCAISLMGPASNVYYHWLVDLLPKVFLAEQLSFHGSYLVPEGPAFIGECLKFYGVTPDRIIQSSNHIVGVHSLAFPTLFYGISTLHAEGIFNDFVTSLLPHSDTGDSFSDRLYISRSKAARRKVANEPELMNVLERYGFQVVCLEDFTVAQQIAMFRKCSIVAGPHGSGMINSIFMPPGGAVVEFFNGSYVNYCMRTFAVGRGLRHVSIVAANDGGIDNFLSDIRVNPEHFEDELKELLT